MAYPPVAQTPKAFWCPPKDAILAGLLALLPRGRAWQSEDGGPIPSIDAAFDAKTFDDGAFAVYGTTGSTLWRFWSAVADVFLYLTQRLCDLRLEFWCATQSETRAQWMIEYGLPDACDPFPDLCTKVAAIGGSRCEYFNEIIARLGWTAQCFEVADRCGAMCGCSRAGARKAVAGGSTYLGLVIKVFTNDPADAPSISGRYRSPRAGVFRAGQSPSCDLVEHPSVTPVRCLMDRIAPAHVTIQYVT